MRFGLDCRIIKGETGIAQYGRNLRAALPAAAPDDEFVFLEPPAPRVPLVSSHLGAALFFRRAKLDLLHVPGGAAPLGYRRPFALTVHDMAIYRHPEWFPEGQWFSTQVAFPESVRRARRIIVPSMATKKDLVELFSTDENKIDVVPHGVISQDIKGMIQQPATRYILFIGTIEPRKNIPTLLRAYRRVFDACPQLRDVEFRLAGAVGWKSEQIEDEIRKIQCEGYPVKMLGPVSEKEKWRLLAGAACLAYPSFYEGFGLPILEAMAAGTPALCSEIPAHVEFASDASLMAPPEDVAAWAANLATVLEEESTADELRKKGAARAREMTWEKSAAATVASYRKAIDG